MLMLVITPKSPSLAVFQLYRGVGQFKVEKSRIQRIFICSSSNYV